MAARARLGRRHRHERLRMSLGYEPSVVVLAAALAVDLVLGELPNAVHPVVWMGKLTSLLERLAPRRGSIRQLLAGTLIAILVPTVFTAASMLAVSSVRAGSAWFVVSVLLLKSTFAIRSLGRAAFAVRDPLANGDLEQARRALRSLCSRDAARLDEPLLVAATVESLAENTSDSFVGPLFYYVLFGLPGAIFYRAVNTLDSMIGYRGRYEYLGKVSARLDDALNFIPARITAGLLLVAGWFRHQDVGMGWVVLRRDGGKTDSPNAGKPMAAMAGLLRVQLEKVGQYRLGNATEALAFGKIDEAWRILTLAVGFFASVALAAVGMRHVHAP